MPKPPIDVPIPSLHSQLFEAVVTDIGGGTLPGLPVQVGAIAFRMQLTDLTNNRRMFFRFFGPAVGTPGKQPDVKALGKLDPQKFTTNLPIKLEHFEGFASYTNGGAMMVADVIVLFGPKNQGAADIVVLHWVETKPGLKAPKATTAFGTLEPTTGAVPV